MQIIGLTGLAASGKSTVANYLVEQHGFTRLSFAAPLKKMLRTLDPILTDTPSDRYTPPSTMRLSRLTGMLDWSEQQIKESSYGPEYRRLLQVLGTDCIRAVDEDFWVHAAENMITDDDGNAEGKYVFDDARFPNEAALITRYNKWGLWRVVRGSEAAADGAHSSEQWAGKMGETQTILNHTSLEHLYAQVEQNLEFTFAGVAV
jgi:hypothetical protein